MGVFAAILGSGVIEKGIDLIDNMHTSTTEEIAAKTKAQTDLMAAYAPFKVAQRYLALLFAFTFIGSFLLVLVCTLAKVGDTTDIRDIISEFWIGEIMIVIIGFYFGGGAFEGAFKARKEK